MKTVKLIALIMSLVLALSMVACNIGNGGATTPESTPAETPAPTKTVEEVIDAVKAYFSGTNINISGTSHSTTTGEESYEENVVLTVQMAGVKTDDARLYLVMDNGTEGATKVTYVDGISYTIVNMMGMEIKVKQEMPVDDLFDSYAVGDIFPYLASMLLDAKVEYVNDTFVLTAKGLTKEAFIEHILGESRDFYETDEEYEEALAEYTYDNTTDATLTVVLDKDGKLVSMTTYESYTWAGDKTVTEDTVNFSYEVPTIAVPEDADDYMDAGDMLG